MTTTCKPLQFDPGVEVLELLPLGICVFNRSLEVSFWNRTLQDWTGVLPEQIIGKNIAEYFPVLESTRMQSRLDQVFETLSPVILSPALHKHFIPVAIEGGKDQMMVQRTTLRPYDDEGSQVVAVIENVTVTHRQLDQLRREKQALVEANETVNNYAKLLSQSNEELEQFAYVASHDLQEPLRKISSYCQLLTEEQGAKLDDEGRDYLTVVTGAADRLRRLVQDLLLFSRITTHGKPLASTNAEECLSVAIDNLEIAIQESGAKVIADTLPWVQAEEGQLTQLLQNLLGNAIKYRGERSPEVHVGVDENADTYSISIRDNGIGIAPQYRERIFKVFQRLHNRRDYEGTGIGLAVCKRIVERFGGEISVDSAPGEGSVFSFSIKKGQPE